VNEIDQNRVQTKAATIPQSASQVYASGELEALFRATFFHSYDTLLEGGAAEPVYLPGHPHRICYTRDYFRSALHEIAHWCVAGPARRQQEDYGYWYAPDGRNAIEQSQFLAVEVRPQAFEALFCAACGHPFRVSLDNLDGDPGDQYRFADQVKALAHGLIRGGLPERASLWVRAMEEYYRPAQRSLGARLDAVFPNPQHETIT